MRFLLLALVIAINSVPAFAGNFPGPMPGQVVSWKWWSGAAQNFVSNRNYYVATNLHVTQTEFYDNTAFRCDFMLDAITPTNGAVYAALTIDGTIERVQGLAGDAGGVITFGFSSLIGDLPAGDHVLGIDVAVHDGSSVSFGTTEPAITCYELALPPGQ